MSTDCKASHFCLTPNLGVYTPFHSRIFLLHLHYLSYYNIKLFTSPTPQQAHNIYFCILQQTDN